MKRNVLLLLLFSASIVAFSGPVKKKKNQQPKVYTDFPKDELQISEKKTEYKGSYTKTFDILKTDIDIVPIFENSTVEGTAKLLLTPYSRPQQTLILDTKGLRIIAVELTQKQKTYKPKFNFTDYKLNIELSEIVNVKDTISVTIKYVAEPYLWDEKGLPVPKERGVYFIDPLDKNPYKYTQLWTQGETEYNSTWFPTIEAMDEKFPQSIKITVDNKFKTLSNGLLIKSIILENGKRTDYWEQKLPHSPYLAFFTVGEYEKVIDKSWNGKEISYYTFPPFGEFAKDVFGNTGEMITFFSNILQTPYPWDKYSQVVSYDYTAGAMENTTASIFYDPLFADRKNLKDQNFDYIIAHELFHQWFGDLVTAESWANLTLNESFANYGEYLWNVYKYGQIEADYYGQKDLIAYLKESLSKKEAIVNFYFENFDDIFDRHRYEKGSIVVKMLRDYLGDSIFFNGLKLYLSQNQFDAAEIHHFRLAMEKASGEDLNWFFNQWWLSKGHPKVVIEKKYNELSKSVEITIQQTQPTNEEPIFRIPIKIDIYTEKEKKTHAIWLDKSKQTFYLPSEEQPKLVNVDADKHILWEKEETLTLDENLYKYFNCPLYLDKKEALIALQGFQQKNEKVSSMYFDAMQKDRFFDLKKTAIDLMEIEAPEDSLVILHLKSIAIDIHEEPKVRISALNKYWKYDKNTEMLNTILENDSSYSVQAEALKLYSTIDKKYTLATAKHFETTNSKPLYNVLLKLYSTNPNADQLQFMQKMLWIYRGSGRTQMLSYYFDWLIKIDYNTFENSLQTLQDVINYEENQDYIGDIKYAISSLKKEWKSSLMSNENIELSKKLKGFESYFSGL
jgi:aminopeptidase N